MTRWFDKLACGFFGHSLRIVLQPADRPMVARWGCRRCGATRVRHLGEIVIERTQTVTVQVVDGEAT